MSAPVYVEFVFARDVAEGDELATLGGFFRVTGIRRRHEVEHVPSRIGVGRTTIESTRVEFEWARTDGSISQSDVSGWLTASSSVLRRVA